MRLYSDTEVIHSVINQHSTRMHAGVGTPSRKPRYTCWNASSQSLENAVYAASLLPLKYWTVRGLGLKLEIELEYVELRNFDSQSAIITPFVNMCSLQLESITAGGWSFHLINKVVRLNIWLQLTFRPAIRARGAACIIGAGRSSSSLQRRVFQQRLFIFIRLQEKVRQSLLCVVATQKAGWALGGNECTSSSNALWAIVWGWESLDTSQFHVIEMQRATTWLQAVIDTA